MIKFKTEYGLISLNAANPEEVSEIEYEENFPEDVREKIFFSYGIYGHSIDDATSGVDLRNALQLLKIKYSVVEGQNILNKPLQEIPEDAQT